MRLLFSFGLLFQLIWPTCAVIELTSSNIQQLTNPSVSEKGTGPQDWLIEFYTSTCTNCENLHSHFEDLTGILAGEMNVGRANVHEHQDIGLIYEISQIPTVLLLHFEGGVTGPIIYRYTGSRKLELLREFAAGGYKSLIPLPSARSLSGTSVSDLVLEPFRIAIEQARAGSYTSLVLVSIPAITLLYILLVGMRVTGKGVDQVDALERKEQ